MILVTKDFMAEWRRHRKLHYCDSKSLIFFLEHVSLHEKVT